MCGFEGEKMSVLSSVLGAVGATSAKSDLPIELVYILRVLLGALFGLMLGIERSRRQKEAGMATHFVVGCASTLMTCVSLWFKEVAELGDGARIAAQIVSGVGFLGAGMIFFRRESLRGLTTAAGIWATAAIGMCTACGMYWAALCATTIIILVQIILHSKHIKRNHLHLLLVKMEYSDDAKQKLMDYFGFETFHRFKVTSVNEKYVVDALAAKTTSDANESENLDNPAPVGKKLFVETVIYPSKNCSAEEIAKFISENSEVHSIERLEDL